MEALHGLVDLFLHLDDHLEAALAAYGGWTYLILFLIIFAETGLVVTPFLPGDSLLFAAGALAARVETLSVGLLFGLLSLAAILGNSSNYAIGHFFGKRLLARRSRLINATYVDRAHGFFERYGGKTIILSRFVPIIRTFAPFVAGLGAMTYGRFFFFNFAGGIAWVGICLFAGYFFGRMHVIQENFSLAVLGIVLVSILPAVFEILKARAERTRSKHSDV